LSTASTVYALLDGLEKACIGAEPLLDKNGRAGKKTASAHSLLWICRRFSTGELLETAQTGVRARLLAMLHQQVPSTRLPLADQLNLGSEPDSWRVASFSRRLLPFPPFFADKHN
jgi:hypothetical protein